MKNLCLTLAIAALLLPACNAYTPAPSSAVCADTPSGDQHCHPLTVNYLIPFKSEDEFNHWQRVQLLSSGIAGWKPLWTWTVTQPDIYKTQRCYTRSAHEVACSFETRVPADGDYYPLVLAVFRSSNPIEKPDRVAWIFGPTQKNSITVTLPRPK
ncbi:MAG TPA: hypothetical protein VFO29_11800 [Candidatus Rubrimentiphilum sp.]|nr:hypothetical protein [Candidatus Rubrimentiphilum sp.]